MNEQFIMRFGINMQAVTTGLQKMSAQVKSVGTSLVNSFKEYGKSMVAGFIGGFVADKIFSGFDAVMERVKTIRRMSAELGVDSNFAQGLMSTMKKAGLDPEAANKPLIKFNVLIGQAKNGLVEARQKLIAWGLATKEEQWNNYTLQNGLGKLRDRFHSLNDVQRQAALMSDIVGKGFSSLLPVLELSDKKFKALSEDNYFTKLTPTTISNWESAKKKFFNFGTTAANLTSDLLNWFLEKEDFADDYLNAGKKSEELLVLEGQARREILDLMEKQLDLQNKISDAGKTSIEAMAAAARVRLGIPEPRSYGVSKRMRAALKIDNLEKKASQAYMAGDDAKFEMFKGEAAQLRRSAMWATAADRNPLQRVESELTKLNEQTAPVKAFAEQVNKQMNTPR